MSPTKTILDQYIRQEDQGLDGELMSPLPPTPAPDHHLWGYGLKI